MIWLKGFIFLIGLFFLYKAGKQLLAIAKQKQRQDENKKQSLVQCQQCKTHVTVSDTQQYKGTTYCKKCIKEHNINA